METPDFIRDLKGYDPAFLPVYFASWSSYEESGWILITEKSGQFYVTSGGHCVMAEGPQDDVWYVDTLSDVEALQLIDECEDPEGPWGQSPY